MSGFINGLSPFLQIAVQNSVHILLAVLGGIVCEKVGNLNLGIEGMMIMGAVFGFSTAYNTGNPFLSLLSACIAGGAGALIYALITVTFKGNQTVTGLVLTIFGTGLAGLYGKPFASKTLTGPVKDFFKVREIPVLSEIPIVGKALFAQSVYFYFAIALAIITYIYLNKTRIGLNARAVGENPAAADASGINVSLYKYLNIVIGGALCGLGGAYLSLHYVPRWQENITAGAGWIAVAFVIFSTWNPIKAIFAALAFGMLRGISFTFQSTPLKIFTKEFFISSNILDMIPYIATIVVLVLMSIKKKKENQSPAALNVPYFREER